MNPHSVTQRVKRLGIAALRGAGALARVKDSGWRGDRLVILCYHGISQEREHHWRPLLYVSQEFFRRRMELLREGGYRVLPLGEALARLSEGCLPERSVALTFDDGFYDFYARAYPVIEEFGFPATVYLTTYYCLNERPVFPLALDYVLWSAEEELVRRTSLMGETFALDLRTEASRRKTVDQLLEFTGRRGHSDLEKQELVQQVADAVDVDYGAILERRITRLMGPEEIVHLSERGVDFQLHTHRHRSPSAQAEYRREIRENRQAIRSLTGQEPAHFCYPSGACRPRFADWLRREDVASAATDWPGLVSTHTDLMFLPRILDHSGLSDDEFLAWMTGLAEWLPHRKP